ncbi:MAG: hypothetical protein J5763_01595 [Bacteroidaceae bacterium]|nr:hypothetical protein [Bacteroidaceae bacterium]
MRKVFLMALLALLSGFSVISCDKDDPINENNPGVNNGSGSNVSQNPFAGNTYKAAGEGRDQDDYFAFQESKVSWGSNLFDYTFDETTFTLYKGTTEVAVVTYKFSEDRKTLTLSSSAGISGIYIKQ